MLLGIIYNQTLLHWNSITQNMNMKLSKNKYTSYNQTLQHWNSVTQNINM